MHRTIEESTGTVVYANPSGTGFKLRGHHDFINTPRADFTEQRLPEAGEVWHATYDVVDRSDGRVAYFARELEYIGEDDQYQPLVIVTDRPAFEDAEWFWTITDERGDIRRETYNKYISSTAWQKRRALVLSNCGGQCEARLPGCTEVATQVHHVSYRFLGCEPVWDLRGTCDSCHSMITGMGRRQQPADKLQAA